MLFNYSNKWSTDNSKNMLAQLYWFFGWCALFIFWPDFVLADPPGASPTVSVRNAETFGDIICNFKMAGPGYTFALSAIAYVMGAFVIVKGVLMLKKHGENPSQPQIVPAVAHLIVGGFLVALPKIAGIIQRTFMGDTSGVRHGCNVFSGGSSSATGLDQMMINFVKNIHGPIFSLLSMIAIIVGLTFIVRALLAGMKTGTDPRAANPRDIVVRLAIGAVLISIGGVLPSMLKSIFGTGDVSSMSSFQGIAWSNIVGSGVDTTAADNAVKAILAFVQIIGGISFLRGWLIVKAAIEGGGQATIPQGVTHIVGGAMAINIDKMLEIFDKTFGSNLIE